MRARRATALLAVIAVLAIPATAGADGDPASDVLLSSDVYLPYYPPPSKALAATITQLLANARKNGYRMKVAVIAGQGDLGAYPNLFNQPQRYTNLLSQEIAFSVRRPHLLVVMPGGFGGQNLGDAVDQALSGINIDASQKSDGLTRAAIQAVAKIAAANGHPTAIPKVKAAPTSGGKSTSSSHTGQYIGAALFALCAIGLIVVLLLRRRPPVADENIT